MLRVFVTLRVLDSETDFIPPECKIRRAWKQMRRVGEGLKEGE